MTDIATNWIDSIGMTVNASYLNGLGTAVNANTHAQTGYGTYASLPSASTSTGQVYFCSDIDTVYRSNGTTWEPIRVGGMAGPAMGNPKSSGLSNTTLGSATFTADLGSRLLSTPSNSGDKMRGEHWALSPTSNYTATFYLDFKIPSGNYSRHGVYLWESSSSKFIMMGPLWNGNFSIVTENWNSTTSPTASFSGQYYLQGASGTSGGSDGGFPHWFRIRDNGTNRIMDFSFNGLDWVQLRSESRTTFITPDYIGWGSSINNGSITSLMRLRSYALV